MLASSLDLATTMHQVAELTIPALADLCVIDLVAEDGAISEVAVAAREPETARGLEALRAEHPLDPAGEHPVASVIRSGHAELLPEMSPPQLSAFAEGSEHARFMLAHHYRSAVVAPLRARARTLGALSAIRLGDGEPYDDEDLELVCELARRAALAIDNARLFGELHELEQRQEAILANLAEAITVEDESGHTVFANKAAADLLGLADPEQLISARPGEIGSRFLILDEQARELDLDAMPGRRLFAGERPGPLLVRNIVRRTGEERWLTIRSSPVLDAHSGRVRFAVNVFENITEVKRAQLAESFMAQVSRVLSSSMDYQETLQRVAQLAVPQIADWCVIDLLGERGLIERVAVHHADPGKIALAERLRDLNEPTPDEPGGVAEVIRTGTPRLYTHITPEALASSVRDPELLRLLHEVGPRAMIIVPLASAVKTLGAITLVSSESRRTLSERDVDLATRLGRRAGTAVENARLFTERARIAHLLQEALLPESLPDIPGAEVHARYCAAGELNEVGGDFYDVFARGPDRWVLVIGDVVGKGARAAGVTALARHTLRAAAMGGHQPAEMLAMLHRALRAQPPGADLCTVCLVNVAAPAPGEAARVTVSLAGHPPPLLLDADGGVRQVGEAGTLLGVFDPVRVPESELQLEPGQTLLMYTDGVLDAGRTSEPIGEDGLIALCRERTALPLDELLGHIEEAALRCADGGLRDDIALLGLRLRSAL